MNQAHKSSKVADGIAVARAPKLPVHENQARPGGRALATRPRRGTQKALKKNGAPAIEADPVRTQGISGDEDRLITAAELAPRLGFAIRRVREWAAVGKLPAIRLNRRDLRFHWPTVIRTLASAENRNQ